MLTMRQRTMTPGERARILNERPGWLTQRIFSSFGRFLAKMIDEDLLAGLVDVLDVEVGRLGHAEPNGDEGPLLFCETADGWVVGLVGQWLYTDEASELDANLLGDAEICRRFHLVRAPKSGLPLLLRSIGSTEPMMPTATVELGRIKYLPMTFVIRGTLESVTPSLPQLGRGIIERS